MKKAWLKYLPFIVSVILLIADSDRLFRLLFSPFSLMDGLSLVPEVLNTPQRYFLYGLWLGAMLYGSVLLWVALTRHNKGYLSMAVALAVFVTGYTLLNIPFGEQNQRRWHSMNQLALPAWARFLNDRDALFEHITERKPFDLQKIIERFTEQKTPLTKLPLGWNKDDAAAVDALWQQASGNREQEAKALTKMADYVSWMPDYAPLVLAQAIFTLTTDDNKTRAEAAFRRAIAIAPDNPDAWLGWSVALIQSHDDMQAHYNRNEPLALSFTTGLLMAEGLKDKPRQPALSQRLATYIEEMPQDDQQILRILQARLQAQSCDMSQAINEKPKANPVLPLRRSILDTNPVRNIVLTSSRSPGHIVLDAEKYGMDTENMSAMPYPEISQYIKSATTILSLDIDVHGLVLNAMVECTSGVATFDKAAMSYATQWRFKPTPQGRRVLIPVTFVSDRPSPKEHFQEMEARAIRIARQAARHNKTAMEAVAKGMVAQSERVKIFFWPGHMTPGDAMTFKSLLIRRVTGSNEEKNKRLNEIIREMEILAQKYPHNAPLLMEIALRKEESSFEERRERWAEMLALAPRDPLVWAGWGNLWSEVDPELYMGAIIYSSLLPLSNPQVSKTMEWETIRRMLSVDRHERNRILFARAITGYADIFGSKKVDVGAGDAEKAKHILTGSPRLNRHEDIFQADPKGRITTDVKPQEIVSAPLLGVPLLEPPIEENKRTELTVDIDKNGRPTLVLVSKSSEVAYYDAQAVNMLWRWKFKPQSSGRQITVGVNFSR